MGEPVPMMADTIEDDDIWPGNGLTGPQHFDESMRSRESGENAETRFSRSMLTVPGIC